MMFCPVHGTMPHTLYIGTQAIHAFFKTHPGLPALDTETVTAPADTKDAGACTPPVAGGHQAAAANPTVIRVRPAPIVSAPSRGRDGGAGRGRAAGASRGCVACVQAPQAGLPLVLLQCGVVQCSAVQGCPVLHIGRSTRRTAQCSAVED